MSDTQTTYPVDGLAALRGALGWLRNPVSLNGPRNLRKVMFASGGPGKQKQVEQMRDHPDGGRILEDRPDLCRALSDMDALATMPEGSLGRAYHEFMSHPAAVPTYLLGALMYENGEFDALEWSEEMKYLTTRLNYTHDLTHVVSGYGTHLIGEAINIVFTLGVEGVPRPAAHALTGLWFAIGLPKVGWRRFHELCIEAYDRGKSLHDTIPWHCIYWEELLPLPLTEVRRRLGVSELSEPLDTSDWIRNPLAEAMAKGYGQGGDAAGKAKSKAVAEKLGGVDADPRDLAAVANLSADVSERLYAAFDRGATEKELREIAGLRPRRQTRSTATKRSA